jgi:MoxR-like ATPase
MDVQKFTKIYNRIVDNVNSVIHGKDDVVRLSMVAICAGGHILFEDVPGVGKSVLARALGASMRAEMSRVQCTPDMLPGDITGSSIIDTKSMKFVFRPGPVFANVLLVDEINRATPKTQSSLLEAMAEKSVSVDGTTHALPKPFLVLATQNPVELAGTFPLPEAQLDRFLLKLEVGYPDRMAELAVLETNREKEVINDLKSVVTTDTIVDMMKWATGVSVSQSVQLYIVDLCQETRVDPALLMGASPRASLALMRAARVLAASQGREDVIPDDVKTLIKPVLSHRLILTPDASLREETVDNVVERIVAKVRVPTGV